MAAASTFTNAKIKDVAALGAYVLLVTLLGVTLYSGFSDLAERQDSLRTSQEQLETLREMQGHMPEPKLLGSDLSPGSVFLSGDKVSIASAEFQRRVATTVTNAGGNVLSSQLERQEATDPNLTDITLAVECEIEQEGLTRLLYDLEAQTPFVFIAGLNIRLRSEAPDRTRPARLRVSLRLLGHWREARS